MKRETFKNEIDEIQTLNKRINQRLLRLERTGNKSFISKYNKALEMAEKAGIITKGKNRLKEKITNKTPEEIKNILRVSRTLSTFDLPSGKKAEKMIKETTKKFESHFGPEFDKERVKSYFTARDYFKSKNFIKYLDSDQIAEISKYKAEENLNIDDLLDAYLIQNTSPSYISFKDFADEYIRDFTKGIL